MNTYLILRARGFPKFLALRIIISTKPAKFIDIAYRKRITWIVAFVVGDVIKSFKWACEIGEFELVKNLIQNHKIPNGILNQGLTLTNSLKIVRFLVENGADLQKSGGRALYKACSSGNLEIVKYLIKNGVPLKNSFMGQAAYSGNMELVNYLLENKIPRHVNSPEPVNYAATNGGLDMLKLMLKLGYKPNKFTFGDACAKGVFEVVEFLLANFKIRAKAINHAIGEAASGGHLKIVKFLIKSGGNLMALKNDILNIAAGSGDLETVKFIVESGYGPENNNDSVFNALHFNFPDIVSYLLEKKATVEHNMLYTPCINGNLETVKILIAAGADYRYSNYYAVRKTVICNGVDIFKYFVSLGYDHKLTQITDAISYGSLKIVKFLVEQGHDYRGEDEKALKKACFYGYKKTIKYLVSMKADINVNNSYIAKKLLKHEHFKVLELVIKLGSADPRLSADKSLL